jgi:capsular polysaccharide transport system permease protein
VGAVPFVLTGYTLITLWRHIIARSLHCFRHNAGLMFHRNVNYLDTLLVRALLELGGTGLSFMIGYLPLYLFGYLELIDDRFVLVAGWLFTGWFSLAVGFILAGLTEMNELVERFVQPIMYLPLPVSGLPYMVAWLPQEAARIVSYSPQVNAMEMFRDGLLGPQVEAQWDAVYTAKLCFDSNRAFDRPEIPQVHSSGLIGVRGGRFNS